MKINGRFSKNMLSLGVLQGINLATTLLTLPYLTRVFDVDVWGSIVFVLLVVNYGVWVVNWGFYLGATQRIAANRDSKILVSKVACDVWVAQCLLACIVTATFLFYFIFCEDQRWQALYISGLTVLIGNLVTPIWLLNGLERVWEASLILVFAKLITVPFIFLCIHSIDDASIYILINGVGSIVAGCACSYWIYSNSFIAWQMPKAVDVWRVIFDDSALFLTSIIANLNTSIVPMALGILGGVGDLGLFNIADRIKGAAISVLNPIVHALYPKIAYLFSSNRYEAIRLIKITGIIMISISSIGSLSLFIFAPQLVALFGGGGFEGAISILRMLAPVTLISTISLFIIHQILMPLDKKNIFLVTTVLTLIVTSVLIYPLMERFELIGAPLTILISESIWCLSLLYACWNFRGIIFGRVNHG